jgi:hypothetical protein
MSELTFVSVSFFFSLVTESERKIFFFFLLFKKKKRAMEGGGGKLNLIAQVELTQFKKYSLENDFMFMQMN